jgi:hypothetical protein
MRQGLRPVQKIILLSLADRADERHMCWPSLPRLAKDTGFDERTVNSALRAMCKIGIISRVEAPGRGYTYTLIGVSGREDTISDQLSCPIFSIQPVCNSPKF